MELLEEDFTNILKWWLTASNFIIGGMPARVSASERETADKIMMEKINLEITDEELDEAFGEDKF